MSSSTADVTIQAPDRTRARLAWSLFAVSIGSTVIGLALSLMAWRASDAYATTVGWSDVVYLVVSLMFSVVGLLIASRRPETLERAGDRLCFDVCDDGLGFDPAILGYGTGLQGIADRLGALDGSIVVESAPGNGTTVRGIVPLTIGSAGPRGIDGGEEPTETVQVTAAER